MEVFILGLEQIKIIMKKKGVTQDELSARSGVPKSTLSKITAGINTNPTLDTVRAIVHALGCTLDDLDDSPLREINSQELTLLERYRAISDESKKRVDNVLEFEFVQMIPENKVDTHDNTSIAKPKFIKSTSIPYQSAAYGNGELNGELTPDENIEGIKAIRNIKNKKSGK